MSGKSDRLGNLLLGAALLVIILLAAWPSSAQDDDRRGCVSRDNQGRNVTVNVRSGPGLEYNTVGAVFTGECYDVLEIVNRQSECNAYCAWVELESIPRSNRENLLPTRLFIWAGLFELDPLPPTATPTPTATMTPMSTAALPPPAATSEVTATPTQEEVPGGVIEVLQFCRITVQATDTGWITIYERCESEETN
jgi:hypothetical protein